MGSNISKKSAACIFCLPGEDGKQMKPGTVPTAPPSRGTTSGGMNQKEMPHK